MAHINTNMANINIIVAFTSKDRGIGVNGGLPWNLPDDLRRFSELTKGTTVVMGKKTWNSIPDNKKPLKDRLNVVVTSSPWKQTTECVSLTIGELDSFLQCRQGDVFIIGGAGLYKRYLGVAKRIYATVIDNAFECDTFFPTEGFEKYEIEECSNALQFGDIKYRYITYNLSYNAHQERSYLELITNILKHGNIRDDRTGTGTFSTFGPQLTFDISKSIPVLTTKFVSFKTVLKELLFFMRGETDSKNLEAEGVNIWKANTSRTFLDNRGLDTYREGLMGPMYGSNWRHFGGDYDLESGVCVGGYDQLQMLIKGLKDDPYSRRHMITTFDPSNIDKCVLAPCHGIITQFYVERGPVDCLSCKVYCRSSDMFLGLPFNIASYAMMTYIVAKKCNMVPKTLIITMGDAHVYKNHIDQVKLQDTRMPFPFPRFVVNDSVQTKPFEELTIDDFDLQGYLYHPSIKAPMAV